MTEKISSRQVILLITICRITIILTVMSTIYMPPANQDIWIINILSFFYTILITRPIVFLTNRFNDLSTIGYMEKIFGKVIGKTIGTLYAVFFIAIAILFFYITIQMIRTSFLVQANIYIIMFVLISCCIYFSSRGIKVIAKSSELFGPVILSAMILFIFLGYNKVDLTVLLPIYQDSTFIDINYGALLLSCIFLDIHILSMIAPWMGNKKDINKVSIKVILYPLIILLMAVIVTQTSLGIEQAKHSNFPFLAFVRLININSIFERIESIYIIMWLVAMIIKITTYINMASQAITEVLKKKENNIILYAVGVIVAISTYYIAEFRPLLIETKSTSKLEYIVYFIFTTIIPLIAVIVYLFRRKSFDKQEKLNN